MASIMQGTTPSLKIIIDPDDLLVSAIADIELYIKNTGLETKTLEDVVIDTVTNSITYLFTVEETAALDPTKQLIVQGRLFSGNDVIGIDKIYFNVKDMLGVGADG